MNLDEAKFASLEVELLDAVRLHDNERAHAIVDTVMELALILIVQRPTEDWPEERVLARRALAIIAQNPLEAWYS